MDDLKGLHARLPGTLSAGDHALTGRLGAEPEGGVPSEVLISFPVHEYTAKPADASASSRARQDRLTRTQRMLAAATALLLKPSSRHQLHKCSSSAQVVPPPSPPLAPLASAGSLPAAVAGHRPLSAIILSQPPILEQASSAPNGGGSTLKSEGELQQEAVQCAICLCDFEGGDMLRQLPCKHEFHQPCIESWAAHHRTCPLCRYLLWEPSAPPSAAPAAGAPQPEAATISAVVPAATADTSTAPPALPLAVGAAEDVEGGVPPLGPAPAPSPLPSPTPTPTAAAAAG